jgi:uncharacterized membrane protein
MGFAKLMATPMGRLIRIVAGMALVAVGIYVGGAWGMVVGVVGAVPLLAGVFNVCLFAPLFGAPFSGARLRPQV